MSARSVGLSVKVFATATNRPNQAATWRKKELMLGQLGSVIIVLFSLKGATETVDEDGRPWGQSTLVGLLIGKGAEGRIVRKAGLLARAAAEPDFATSIVAEFLDAKESH